MQNNKSEMPDQGAGEDCAHHNNTAFPPSQIFQWCGISELRNYFENLRNFHKFAMTLLELKEGQQANILDPIQ